MSAFTLSSSYAVANASALVKSRGVKVRVVRAPSRAQKTPHAGYRFGGGYARAQRPLAIAYRALLQLLSGNVDGPSFGEILYK